MKIKIVVFILIPFIVWACKNEAPESLEDYFNNSAVQLENHIVKVDDLFLGQVWDIEGFGDYLILLDDHQERYFSLIDLNRNRLIKRFGTKGRGPQEMMEPVGIGIHHSNNTFQMLLRNPERFVEYSIDSLLQQNTANYLEVVKFNFKEESLYNISPLYDGKRYVGTGLFHRGKYGITNEMGVLDTVVGSIHIPDDQRNIDYYQLGMVYQGITKSHPSESKFVHASTSSDLIEIVDSKSFESKHFQSYFPKVTIHNGMVGETPDSRIGFIALKVTSKYIYALFSGRTVMDQGGLAFSSNRLYVFNWDLMPIASYVLDKDVNCFFVTEDDKSIYSTTDINDEMQLVKWNMQH